jgi:threonine dehydrogenase-like Zn-dependent dehydrogenase
MFAGHIPERGCIDLIDVPEPAWPPVDAIGPAILFQPELACLCGSDLPYFECSETRYPPGVGHSLHEMIGTVLATTGSRFKPGERVLAVPVDQRGLFERFVVSESRAIPLPANVPDAEALLAQPLGTVLYALRKLPPVLGETVVVVGQGPIGQLFNLALRNLGAAKVIGVDRDRRRLVRSGEHGATHAMSSEEETVVDAVREITCGAMADLVIEAVGHADQALNVCIELARRHGRLLVFGVPTEVIDGVCWRELFVKNLTVHTSVNPDFDVDFPLAMQWIAEGRIDVRSLVTHRFPLSEIQRAFETFRDHTDGALKVLVEFPALADRSR